MLLPPPQILFIHETPSQHLTVKSQYLPTGVQGIGVTFEEVGVGGTGVDVGNTGIDITGIIIVPLLFRSKFGLVIAKQ